MAVVGAGIQGSMIARAVKEVVGAELVGLVDANPARLAEAADALGLQADHRATDWSDLLARYSVDLAVIATTAPSHCALAEQAMDAGVRRILVEKPLDSNLERATAFARRVTEQAAHVAVDYTRRWLPDHRSIVAAVRSGAIGEVRSVMASAGGGQLAMHGSHWVDFARMVLGGDVVEVRAELRPQSAPNVRGTDFDDPTGQLWLRFSSGARATIDFDEDTARRYGAVIIRGDDGLILLEEQSQEWSMRGRSGRVWRFPMALPFLPAPNARATLIGMLSEPTPACTTVDGSAALEVVFAAHHSAACAGVAVKLPLTGDQRTLALNFP